MICRTIEQKEFFEAVLDAVSLPMLVVNKKLQVHAYNDAAGSIIDQKTHDNEPQYVGEALKCLGGVNGKQGCGNNDCCGDCQIRKWVGEAFTTGAKVRNKAGFKWVRGDEVVFVSFLVTASPFKYKNKQLVILTLEDIGKALEMKSLLPICGECKQIRDEEDHWQPVEGYLNDHLGQHFSHGLCPRCVAKLYPASGRQRVSKGRATERKKQVTERKGRAAKRKAHDLSQME